jgi:hypothetical protein
LITTAKPSKDKPSGRALYRCNPEGCPVRDKCTDSVHGRSVYRYGNEAVRERMAVKTSTPEGKVLLRRRKAIVEHKFGQIKANEGFRRSLRKGLENAKVEWSLICCASNLWKLYRVSEKGVAVVRKAA